MSDRFKNIYRIPANRHPNWDYGWNGGYFITICTQNKEHFFGDIVDGNMQLSEIGEIVQSEWLKTSDIRPDMNLELDVFAIMPNHFHAIINICENQYNSRNRDGANTRGGDPMVGCRDAMHCVSTSLAATNHDEAECQNKFGPQQKNLASIIRGFKSAVKKYATMHNIDFAWQPRYHDHIIRSEEDYKRIRNYIIDNPQNWDKDRYCE